MRVVTLLVVSSTRSIARDKEHKRKKTMILMVMVDEHFILFEFIFLLNHTKFYNLKTFITLILKISFITL